MSAPNIQFGTDGWRAVIGEEFTYANVEYLAHAYAMYLQNTVPRKPSVVVGYDTRFQANEFAKRFTQVLQHHGISATLSTEFLPTPVLSFATRYVKADGGVMFTASHNPGKYLGVKFKNEYGESVDEFTTSQIMSYLPQAKRVRRTGDYDVSKFSVRAAYYKRLASLVDLRSIRSLGISILHDVMGGASSKWLENFFIQNDMYQQIQSFRYMPDPNFYGITPEPIERNLHHTQHHLRTRQLASIIDFVAALDGDGDRIGVLDEQGTYMDSSLIAMILLLHLVKKGRTGTMVKTVSSSYMLEQLALNLGVKVKTTKIGFKYVAEEMRISNAFFGCEESGGYGYSDHLLERDGLLTTLLLMESIAKSNSTLRQQAQEAVQRSGTEFLYVRKDINNVSSPGAKIAGLAKNLPTVLGGFKVKASSTLDGLKLFLGQNAWILLRASGTEPVLRVYCEAPTYPDASRIIRDATQKLNEPETEGGSK